MRLWTQDGTVDDEERCTLRAGHLAGDCQHAREEGVVMPASVDLNAKIRRGMRKRGVVLGLARLSHSIFQMSPKHTLHRPARLEIPCVLTRFILRCPMATPVL